ncbi:MAG TPA: alpha/beta fold hydrolase [Candidatus Sulfotelmatobacter sp.]|jgi:acetyl esterase/lipase|nr:alpha/beta fold hydrolase [Candidatus Sulfotelmatobacter sp.]
MTSSDDILSLVPPKADARVTYGSDGNQFVDLRMPKGKGPHPVAICLHGGFWRAKYDLEYLGHLCAALTAKGIATANVEYRRVGNAGGGWPGTFADIRAAYQFLTQSASRYGFDTGRVIVLGHSAGGQLALCLAARETGVKAAISLAGVVDLKRAYELHLSNDAVVEFLGGTPAEVADHYREADPMKLAIGARQFAVHGSADDIVPPSFSKDYVKAKAKEDARLVMIAEAGHFDLVDPRSRVWPDVEKVVLGSLGRDSKSGD